ncbi:MAG: fasciclin domain-containing protein, partial [Pseudomonadota bacterium]
MEASKTITGLVLDVSGASGFDHDGGDFDILREALIATDLAGVVDDPEADFTVFAPTDAAFGALAVSLGFNGDVSAEGHVFSFLAHATGFRSADHPGLLDDILLYHVAPEGRLVEELEADGVIDTANGETVTVAGGELIDNDPDLENPEFIAGATDIEVANGVVQAVDRVLLPVDLDEAVAQPTIADIVVATSGASGFDHQGGDFDILREALAATDLLGAVSDPDADFTVFAPTDAAFGELAASLGFQGELSNEAHVFAFLAEATGFQSADEPGLLDDVLLYHVAPEGRRLEELQADGEIETANGETVTVSGDQVIDNEPDLDNPEFIAGATDIEAANGVVQAIDRVLLPLDLEEAVADPVITDVVVSVSGEDGFDDNAGDFDLLREALEATGLDAVVSDPDADFTVFAPTDGAFADLAVTLGYDGDAADEAGVFAFLAEATSFESADEPGLLDDILLYHVAPGAQTVAELRHAGEVGTAFGETVTIAGDELVDNDPDIANPEFVHGVTDIETANGLIQAIDGVLLPIDLDEPVPEASIVGTAAAEAVTGTDGADVIFGDAGDDQVMGRNGDDLV